MFVLLSVVTTKNLIMYKICLFDLTANGYYGNYEIHLFNDGELVVDGMMIDIDYLLIVDIDIKSIQFDYTDPTNHFSPIFEITEKQYNRIFSDY
jgi:hypothetical protein